jgi:hypothetical protein
VGGVTPWEWETRSLKWFLVLGWMGMEADAIEWDWPR